MGMTRKKLRTFIPMLTNQEIEDAQITAQELDEQLRVEVFEYPIGINSEEQHELEKLEDIMNMLEVEEITRRVAKDKWI